MLAKQKMQPVSLLAIQKIEKLLKSKGSTIQEIHEQTGLSRDTIYSALNSMDEDLS